MFLGVLLGTPFAKKADSSQSKMLAAEMHRKPGRTEKPSSDTMRWGCQEPCVPLSLPPTDCGDFQCQAYHSAFQVLKVKLLGNTLTLKNTGSLETNSQIVKPQRPAVNKVVLVLI